MTVTALPEVLAAVVAAARAGLPDVLVVGGPPRVFADEQHRTRTLYIGWGIDEGAAESVRESDDLADSDDTETLMVICAADSWIEGDNPLAACAAVVDLLRRLDALLRADESLGSVVYEAKLGRRTLYDWRPDQSSGTRGSAAFTIEARVL